MGDFFRSAYAVIMVSGCRHIPRPCLHGAHAMAGVSEEGETMAAMKPRTGDGPLEVTKEGRGIVLRMPLEGGGRLVVEMTPDEAAALRDAIAGCEGVK